MYFSVLGDFVFGAKKSLSVMVSVQIAIFSQLFRMERLLLLTPAYPNLQVGRTDQARPFHILSMIHSSPCGLESRVSRGAPNQGHTLHVYIHAYIP